MQRTLIYSFKLIGGALLLFVALPAFAQSYNDNYDPARANVMFYPPADHPTDSLPPPPGDGLSNPTATPGDPLSSKPPVPSGLRSTVPEEGTYFEHDAQSIRSRVNLLVDRGTQTVDNTSTDRGTRVALTFQPDEIPDSKRSEIEGILGIGSGGLSSQPYQNFTVSASTLEQIEKILYPPAQPDGTTNPYPGTPAPGDTLRITPWTERSYIATDTPAQGYPRYQNTSLPGSLTQGIPAVLNQGIRDFSLYLVILGVVVACVQIMFAGAFMAMGHQYAGSKAIAAIGGLMLLLMAFTIWKVDIFNVLNARGQPQGANAPDSFDVRNPPVDAVDQVTGAHTYDGDHTLPPDKKSEGSTGDNPQANLPQTPAKGSGQSQPRSGLPLLPLGSRH